MDSDLYKAMAGYSGVRLRLNSDWADLKNLLVYLDIKYKKILFTNQDVITFCDFVMNTYSKSSGKRPYELIHFIDMYADSLRKNDSYKRNPDYVACDRDIQSVSTVDVDYKPAAREITRPLRKALVEATVVIEEEDGKYKTYTPGKPLLTYYEYQVNPLRVNDNFSIIDQWILNSSRQQSGDK